jgi:hypothetical protein
LQIHLFLVPQIRKSFEIALGTGTTRKRASLATKFCTLERGPKWKKTIDKQYQRQHLKANLTTTAHAEVFTLSSIRKEKSC